MLIFIGLTFCSIFNYNVEWLSQIRYFCPIRNGQSLPQPGYVIILWTEVHVNYWVSICFLNFLTAVYFFNSLHYMKCIQLPNRWKVVTPFLIFLHQILLIYISTEKKIVKKISSLSINVLHSETCVMKNLQWDKNYVFQKF